MYNLLVRVFVLLPVQESLKQRLLVVIAASEWRGRARLSLGTTGNPPVLTLFGSDRRPCRSAIFRTGTEAGAYHQGKGLCRGGHMGPPLQMLIAGEEGGCFPRR
jgi:hypothetical protein